MPTDLDLGTYPGISLPWSIFPGLSSTRSKQRKLHEGFLIENAYISIYANIAVGA